MYSIDKTFEFEYGHRVWSQKLNSTFSLDSKCICRYLHGHHGVVKVHLSSQTLVDGMVTDFKHLNIFKKFVDDVLDHKFILDVNDPLFFLEAKVITKTNDFKFYKTIDVEALALPKDLPDDVVNAVKEKYESYVLVSFVPTSENICKWLCDIANEMLKDLSVKVNCIEFNETPKSHCVYSV